MKLCIAQTRPVKGDVNANIRDHKKFIAKAIYHDADVIIFPELSITGYEPGLAKDLATTINDKRFDEFQQISNESNIIIGIGMPIRKETGNLIGMILFRPGQPRQVYCKQYLHSDEYPFFVSGNEQVYLNINDEKAAIAICYELSIPEHAANACSNKAGIYIASVAKTANGVEKSYDTLAALSKKYSMTVVMSNCVGPCDNFQSAGESAAWNSKGELIGRLNDVNEGILLIDTVTQKSIIEMFNNPQKNNG